MPSFALLGKIVILEIFLNATNALKAYLFIRVFDTYRSSVQL